MLKLDYQNLGLRVVLFVLVASPSLDCATHTTAQPGPALVGHAPRVRRPRVRIEPPATAIRCRSNADCGDVAGTTCRSTSTMVSGCGAKLHHRDGCRGHGDCANSLVCARVKRPCSEPYLDCVPRCRGDGDCEPGQLCSGDGTCRIPLCRDGCPTLMMCVDGVHCQPISCKDPACPDDRTCRFALCLLPECAKTADCPSGECINGVCDSRPCKTDSQCTSAAPHCVNGRCDLEVGYCARSEPHP